MAHLIEWLQVSYPSSSIKLLDYSRGSTTSCVALKHLRDLSASSPVDLLLVDHSLNDEMDPTVLSSITEDIIREGLSRQMAMIYLSDRMTDNLTEVAYSRVTETYQIPLLSYRLGVWDLLPNPYPTRKNFHDLWSAPLWICHPPLITHYYVAMFISIYFTSLIQFSNTSSPILPPDKHFNLSPTSDRHSASSSSAAYCEDPYTDLNSGDTPDSITGFQPLNVPNFNHGWSYLSDHPDKPYGWISYTNETLPSSPFRPSSVIAFPLVLVRGEISLTYLSTYENAGIIEIYLATPTSYSSNPHGHPQINRPHSLNCCNQTKTLEYKNSPLKVDLISNSVWVDTFHSSPRVSAITVRTFMTHYIGSYILVLEHRPLDPQTFAKRGGDKVKILGVRSC
jgi:hypothetical protein